MPQVVDFASMNFALRLSCWIRWVLCLAVLSNGLASGLMSHPGTSASPAAFFEICTDLGIVQVAADASDDGPGEAPTQHSPCPFCLHAAQPDVAPGPTPWLADIDTRVTARVRPGQTRHNTSPAHARHPVRAPPILF